MDAGYPLGQAMLGQALAESGSPDEGIALLRLAAPLMDPVACGRVDCSATTLREKVMRTARGRCLTSY